MTGEFELGPPGAVKGRVRRLRDRVGIGSAQVALFQSGTTVSTVVTGEDGAFEFPDLAVREYEIRVTASESLLFFRKRCSTSPGSVTDLGDIAISNDCRVFGVLQRLSLRQGEPNAVIVLSDDHTGRQVTTRTLSDGSFEFTGLGAANYTIKAPDYFANDRLSVRNDESRRVVLSFGYDLFLDAS